MMSRRTVLYISYDGMTDPLGQSQVLPYLVGLSKKGYNIHLLSFEKEGRFQKGRLLIEQICKDAGIQWHPKSYTKKPPILSTVKDVRAMRKTAALLHAIHHFDLIHCRSYIAALAGQWMKKQFGMPFIFDMRGFWADERVDGGIWNLSNPVFKRVYRFFKRKEKQFLREAAAIISLTHNAKKELESRTSLEQPLPIAVIPCCVDLDLFNPENISPEMLSQKRDTLNIDASGFVVSYIGSIGTWYLLDEMLLFFKVLKEKYSNAIFLFITTESAAFILDRAIVLGIAKESFRITPAARKEMPLYISLSDYSLFFIKPAYSKKASSPTKQGEIMAMGKPIICNTEVGDTDYIIKKYNAGLLIDTFSDEQFEKVVSAIENTVFDNTIIQNGANDFFSLEKGVVSYEAVYEAILNGKRYECIVYSAVS